MSTSRRTSGRIKAPVTYNVDSLLVTGSDSEDQRYVSEEEAVIEQDSESESEDEFTVDSSKQKEQAKKGKKDHKVKKEDNVCHLQRLPFELLCLILGEVHPSALYHLALLSKQFYALLSSEAARTIWKTSRENHVFKYRPDGAITVDEAGVDHGIGEKWQDADGKDWRLVTYPDPIDFTELQFAHLCFSTYCWLCRSSHGKTNALYSMGIRSCQPCRRANLIKHEGVTHMGKIFKALLPCLAYTLMDGAAAKDPVVNSADMYRRYMNTQVDNLRLRLYDVKKNQTLEGNLSLVPGVKSDVPDDTSRASSPLSEQTEGAETSSPATLVEAPVAAGNGFSDLEERFFAHETARVLRLQAFGEICMKVEEGLQVEKKEQIAMKEQQLANRRAAYKKTFTLFAALHHDATEEDILKILDLTRSSDCPQISTALLQAKPFNHRHYAEPQQIFMRARLNELLEARIEHLQWNMPFFVRTRALLQSSVPQYKLLLKKVPYAKLCVNEARLWELPTMKYLKENFDRQTPTAKVLREAFQGVIDAVETDMNDLCRKIQSDLLQLIQDKRNSTAALEKRNPKRVASSELHLVHTIFSCRKCFRFSGNFELAMVHQCVNMEPNLPRPNHLGSIWGRRAITGDNTRPRPWHNDTLSYSPSESRAYVAVWSALHREDSTLAKIMTTSTQLAELGPDEITFTCNSSCRQLGVYAGLSITDEMSARTMLGHLVHYTHTGDPAEDWCFAEAVESGSEEEDYY